MFNEEDTRPYGCDGLSAYRQLPVVAALPQNEERVRMAVSKAGGHAPLFKGGTKKEGVFHPLQPAVAQIHAI